MSSTLPKPGLDVPRRMLTMRGESVFRKSENDHIEARQWLGRVIERTLEIADVERKFASASMGYDDPKGAILTRWIAGTENPQLARFLRLIGPHVLEAFIVALAEAAKSPAVGVQTVISVDRARAREEIA